MSLADYLTELADWNARNEKARDTYHRQQAKPPRRCRTCGDEMDGFLPCPCRYEEQP